MKGLAIIVPLEDINKEHVYSELYFIDLSNRHKVIKTYVPHNIFKYYFYGATLEVVELDNNNNCVNIHDITKDDMIEYSISLSYALTLSFTENEVVSLATNGFTYYLYQSTFFRRYKYIFNNMCNAMKQSNNFVLRYFIMNGAICYVQLECNKSRDAVDYKYVMHNGFAISNRDILKSLLPKTEIEFNNSTEKLSQMKIDQLIDKLFRVTN